MVGYIFRRIVLVSFIAMTLLFAWSLFGPTEYHYTKYHDVHIISEKTEMVRNNCCDTKEHDHYMIPQITVEWIGTNSNGETKRFTTKFDDEDDYDDGLVYQDLKNGFAKEHNCWKSGLTWLGFILLTFGFIFIYLPEDLDDDYTSYETEDINHFRISLWCTIAEFSGYNSDLIMNVFKLYENQNLSNRILKYKELYSKYKEEYKKFSEIQVTANEN